MVATQRGFSTGEVQCLLVRTYINQLRVMLDCWTASWIAVGPQVQPDCTAWAALEPTVLHDADVL
jgi:hypothetical protein